MEQVRDAAHLRRLLQKGKVSFALALEKSVLVRKEASALDEGRYMVFHDIDERTAKRIKAMLLTDRNIGRALKRGTLFVL